MNDQSEEQLNRLIHAYNSQENEFFDNCEENGDLQNNSIQIRIFEQKLKSTNKNQTFQNLQSLKTFKIEQQNQLEDYKTPAVSTQIANYKQLDQINQTKNEPIIKSIKDQIEELKFEEKILENEHIETAFSDALSKNKHMINQIQQETRQIDQLQSKKDELEKEVEKLKLLQDLKNAKKTENSDNSIDIREKVRQNEEKLTDLSVKINILEMTLAKNIKLFKRELPEFESIDVLLASGSNWKGRSEKITLLKSKIELLKAEKSSQPSTDAESISSASVKKPFIGLSEKRMQELKIIKTENEGLVE